MSPVNVLVRGQVKAIGRGTMWIAHHVGQQHPFKPSESAVSRDVIVVAMLRCSMRVWDRHVEWRMKYVRSTMYLRHLHLASPTSHSQRWWGRPGLVLCEAMEWDLKQERRNRPNKKKHVSINNRHKFGYFSQITIQRDNRQSEVRTVTGWFAQPMWVV